MEWKAKYSHWLQGAAAGAAALWIVGFAVFDWHTTKGVARVAEAAAWTALLPACADAILANPAAVAALKLKKPQDYDDVVRDHLKTIADRTDIGFMFRRDCGKAIEVRLEAAKK